MVKVRTDFELLVSKKTFFVSFVTFTVLLLLFTSASAEDTVTANSTTSSRSNDTTMRGFDPVSISSPNDPFPDTSDPCCFLDTSTQFGNGVPSGSSASMVEQTRNVAVVESGMSSNGSILSGPGSTSGQRVNHIESSFTQDTETQGQTFSMAFSIDSTTDSDGNLVGQATGSFTQVVSDPVSTQGVIRICTGTFTYDDVNGYVLTSGPQQQCE